MSSGTLRLELTKRALALEYLLFGVEVQGHNLSVGLGALDVKVAVDEQAITPSRAKQNSTRNY